MIETIYMKEDNGFHVIKSGDHPESWEALNNSDFYDSFSAVGFDYASEALIAFKQEGWAARTEPKFAKFCINDGKIHILKPIPGMPFIEDMNETIMPDISCGSKDDEQSTHETAWRNAFESHWLLKQPFDIIIHRANNKDYTADTFYELAGHNPLVACELFRLCQSRPDDAVEDVWKEMESEQDMDFQASEFG